MATGEVITPKPKENGNGLENVQPIPTGAGSTVVENSASTVPTVGAVVSPQSIPGHPARKAKILAKQRIKVLANDTH